jgi:hypothetical protein
MSMKQFFGITILLVLAFNQQAFSQQKDSISIAENRLLTKRFVITTGLFVSSKSVKIGVDGNYENEIIDFGDSLSQQEPTFVLNFLYRFSNSKKWSVSAEYFAVKSSKESILENPLHWENIEYPSGTKLGLGFGFRLYRLLFGRVISRGEKHELIGGLGVHAMDIYAYTQALAYTGTSGFDVSNDFKKNTVSSIASVPNIGFRYLYAPSKKWSLQARADYFSLNTSDYGGHLWNLGASANYQLFNNVGIGLSYKIFNTKLKISEELWNGSVNLLYHGPLIFVSVNF